MNRSGFTFCYKLQKNKVIVNYKTDCLLFIYINVCIKIQFKTRVFIYVICVKIYGYNISYTAQ